MQNISKDQGSFVVIDSVLSEEAVLGFEYGYATAEPTALVVWEAQFGDFANGAQVVIDQFISSGEAKWGRVCGLTMFLPHGYEGQGPEHSSARLERYLQLCAEHNMQVCVPSNAAQIFHLLRRQMLRPFRKPLVVLTPKSLLRKKEASVPIKELANGSFLTVVPEIDALEPKGVTRIVACCGKVYYDLLSARRERRLDHVAIIRVEQLYPFPHKAFAAEMRALSERARGRLVPGGAAEPGRVVRDGALLQREHAPRPEAVLRRAAAVRRARGRLSHQAPGAPGGAGGHGIWQVQAVTVAQAAAARRVTRWFFANPGEA